jgi:hypothetical protein
MKEENKKEELRIRIGQEKIDRARQIQNEIKDKKKVQKNEKLSDLRTVNRLKEELETEIKMIIAKRENEKRHLMKMLEENEENKKQKLKHKERIKQEDIFSQEEYAKMLDQQERDRANEFQTRMKRMQELMNK